MTEIPQTPKLAHEPAMYPYQSHLAQNVNSLRTRLLHRGKFSQYADAGFSLDEELSRRHGPFIELGGPTESGYFYLHKKVLPKRVIASNIRVDHRLEAYAQFVERMTDLVLDGADLELPSGSMGMVLASHIPRTAYLPESANGQWLDIVCANNACREAARRGEVSEGMLYSSLRLKIAKEVGRVLEPGGLYLTDGTADELTAYQCFGPQIRAYIRDDSRDPEGDPYYYAVLQKP